MPDQVTKRLLVIAGPNGSGKSSLVYSTRLSISLDRIINPDNYARGLADDIPDPVERYLVAMNSCKVLRNTLLEQGESFGFETVASTHEKLEFVTEAKSHGYFIDFIFVTAGSPDICYQRVLDRVENGGHDVPKEKVFSRFERSMGFLGEYIDLSDHAEVWDNSGDHLVLVLSKKNGVIRITDEGKRLPWVHKYLTTFTEASTSHEGCNR